MLTALVTDRTVGVRLLHRAGSLPTRSHSPEGVNGTNNPVRTIPAGSGTPAQRLAGELRKIEPPPNSHAEPRRKAG